MDMHQKEEEETGCLHTFIQYVEDGVDRGWPGCTVTSLGDHVRRGVWSPFGWPQPLPLPASVGTLLRKMGKEVGGPRGRMHPGQPQKPPCPLQVVSPVSGTLSLVPQPSSPLSWVGGLFSAPAAHLVTPICCISFHTLTNVFENHLSEQENGPLTHTQTLPEFLCSLRLWIRTLGDPSFGGPGHMAPSAIGSGLS